MFGSAIFEVIEVKGDNQGAGIWGWKNQNKCKKI